MNGTLACSANNCVHNMSGLCSAKNITIAGNAAQGSSQTLCGTFKENSIGNLVSSIPNMNISGEMRQFLSNNKTNPQMNPSIDCTATKCTYNFNETCTASHVVVSGADARHSENTQCETFVTE